MATDQRARLEEPFESDWLFLTFAPPVETGADYLVRVQGFWGFKRTFLVQRTKKHRN
jgi:hypothetical protein